MTEISRQSKYLLHVFSDSGSNQTWHFLCVHLQKLQVTCNGSVHLINGCFLPSVTKIWSCWYCCVSCLGAERKQHVLGEAVELVEGLSSLESLGTCELVVWGGGLCKVCRGWSNLGSGSGLLRSLDIVKRGQPFGLHVQGYPTGVLVTASVPATMKIQSSILLHPQLSVPPSSSAQRGLLLPGIMYLPCYGGNQPTAVQTVQLQITCKGIYGKCYIWLDPRYWLIAWPRKQSIFTYKLQFLLIN